MAKRKQTPDVLAEILGGEPALVETQPILQPKPVPAVPGPDVPPDGWEYIVVSFQDYKGWRPRFKNGRELKDWMNGPLLHEYIEVMGAEGWELAAASAGERMFGNADHHQLYFKRLKV